MSGLKKVFKLLSIIAAGILVLLLLLFIYLAIASRMPPPEIADKSSLEWKRTQLSPTAYTLKKSWFRKSNSGLYELYVEGKPFERGVVYGKLTDELVKRQEDHFTEQIEKMVPSTAYRYFLKYLIGWFNRRMPKNIPEEYKEEIYGVSFAASPDYGYIGTNYQRIMNYHAAHDIGHALQNLMLVGCTSFATWNDRSEDSSLIIGRNFDFYVGDKFAKEKIVAFYRPDSGYRFMMITWAGFTGVVSGMNEQGLTVTINAARSDIPTSAATPVSLVAREILQYAKNIDEAYKIAHRRKMFVSESFMIGSALDNRAAIIEKTPDTLALYSPKGSEISCANHFQSPELANTLSNKEQLGRSASPYRYARLQELLKRNEKNSVGKTIEVLRDRKGLEDSDIGLGNERALNQMIAHHSVVFEPKKRRVWVSTAPWQLGQFVAYDLDKIFAMDGLKADVEIRDSIAFPADTFLLGQDYKNFTQFRAMKADIIAGKPVDLHQFIRDNPMFYQTYMLAGDYMFKRGNYRMARGYYRQSMLLGIPTQEEKEYVIEHIDICDQYAKGL